MTDLWLGFAVWATASGCLLAVALLVGHLLRLRTSRLDLLVIWFLWIFLVTLLVLVLGLLGLLRPEPALAAALVGLLATIAGLGRQAASGVLGATVATLSGFGSGLGRALRAHPMALGGALVLAWLEAVRLVVHVWILPPYIWMLSSTICLTSRNGSSVAALVSSRRRRP